MDDLSCLHTDMEVLLIDCNYTYDHKLFEFSYFCSLRFTLIRYDIKLKLKDITKILCNIP